MFPRLNRRGPIEGRWRRAVYNSAPYQRLQEVAALPIGAEVLEGGPFSNVMTPSLQKFIQYLLSEEKLWARSYKQYIATRRKCSKTWTIPVATREGQFCNGMTKTFQPIMEEMDRLFASMGWL